ncbi:unnamed protein product [Effrenium voratum]|uniref:PKD/REJ-like domain-containing protein n=1 Tax=Effrenium voratum TaxID=2562239 RepID=A0AA36MNL3_9DINO|nr:unnamed protein product [Effrenium voratum]
MDSTITIGSRVEILPGSLTTRSGQLMASAEAFAFSNQPMLRPRAVVQASPARAQACSRISVTASTSTAVRGLRSVAWSFGNGSTPQLAQQLEAKLDTTEISFQISEEEFFAAVEQIKAEMGSLFHSSEMKLEFVADITNWLGMSDQASATVYLERTEEPMPIVSPTSSVSAFIFNSEPVAFSVETRAHSSCGNTSIASTSIAVTWEYREDSGPWMDLAISGKVDLDRRPGGVRFGAFTFAPGTKHSLRASARYASQAVATSYNFSLTVSEAAPLEARILGPSASTSACGFSLDASGSVDPSSPSAGLAFQWSCDSCPDLGATDSAVLVAGGGQLQEGIYNFSVRVSQGGRVTEAFWPLEVTNSSLPPVSIAVPWASGEAVSKQRGFLGEVTAAVPFSAGCTVPSSWVWSFVLVAARRYGRDGDGRQCNAGDIRILCWCRRY